MKFMASEYTNYENLIERVGIDKIEHRYQLVYEEMAAFIERLNAQESLLINERVLMHALLEYFEDIEKVKSAHDLDHTNSPKVMAYLAQWLLRRQPIQILTQNDNDENLVFVNEKFVLAMLMSFMTRGSETKSLVQDNLKVYKAFLNSFFYYLKFRRPDAQAIEMIILAFHAGKIFPEVPES